MKKYFTLLCKKICWLLVLSVYFEYWGFTGSFFIFQNFNYWCLLCMFIIQKKNILNNLHFRILHLDYLHTCLHFFTCMYRIQIWKVFLTKMCFLIHSNYFYLKMLSSWLFLLLKGRKVIPTLFLDSICC